MKKLFISLIVCLCIVNIQAQLTLEATFVGNVTLRGSQWKEIQSNESYLSIWVDNNTISNYSSADFSLIETLTVMLDQGYRITAYNKIPFGLYKNDGREYYLILSEGGGQDKFGIYKKTGNSLTLDCLVASADAFLDNRRSNNSDFEQCQIWTDGTKCYLFLYMIETYGNDYTTKIYSFSGLYDNVSNTSVDNLEIKPYPNPAINEIHLPFESVQKVSSIKICDVQGKMIERIPVGDGATEYVLNVSSYPSGLYFYEINGSTQTFVVQ